MAKGRERNLARKAALGAFGKDLARRSRSRCELCGASGESLAIYEIPPVPAEPEYERCLFLCDPCRSQIDNPRSLQPERWRALSEAIWSEIPAVQVMAARILEHIAQKEAWAREILDEAQLDEEVERWVGENRF